MTLFHAAGITPLNDGSSTFVRGQSLSPFDVSVVNRDFLNRIVHVNWSSFNEEVTLSVSWLPECDRSSWIVCSDILSRAYCYALTLDADSGHRPYWWSDEFSEAKRLARTARRTMQRIKRRADGLNQPIQQQAILDSSMRKRQLAILISANK